MSSIRRSLAMKLSLGILLMAVPIFLLALGIMFFQSRRFIRMEAMERANSALNTTLQRVRVYMGAIETATNSCEWLVEEDFQPDKLLELSNRIVRLNRHANGCSITAEPEMFPQYGRYFSAYSIRNGDSIETVREAEYEYFEKPWYKRPREQGEACWVDPFDDYNEGTLYTTELIASYCKPLHGEDGQIIGVISTDLSMRHLAATLDSADHPYPNAYFVLLGGKGHYFIHPDTTRLYKKTIFSDADPKKQSDLIALGHEMTDGKQGNMRVFIDGQPCLVCYRPVPATDWSLALVCPDSDILKSYHKLGYIIIALIIVGLTVILILCRRAVGHTIRPIGQLLDKLQCIADGNYDTYIPSTNREDAIGRLQNSFATMLQSLNFHLGSIRYTADQTKMRNEELALATQQAEEATRQKTIFMQNVTHQIRTPLNIIHGFAQVLCDSLKHGASLPQEEVSSITNMMKHNAISLHRMVLMLFDSSDMGVTEELMSHKQDLIPCNKLARECIDYEQQIFPNVHMRFETDLPDDYCISTSQHYLMLSLRELLYNASKYSDGQHIVLRLSQTETTVRFIIEDKGPGISEEYREQMFTAFTKADDLSEGLGLGLPLSKRHALSVGGDLILDPDYHEGCRFIFELPK